MIDLPNPKKSFEYENNFYLSCDTSRIAKMLAHYEAYKMVQGLPGAIVECGVFKGVSFSRFGMYREILENNFSRKLIGFDMFDRFPETTYEADINHREKFIQSAGDESISLEQLQEILKNKKIDSNVELIKGNIVETIPKYIEEHKELKISLLNLDTDVYEPAVTILDNLYPCLVKGGILLIDDYGVFPGETSAVDEYFKDKDVIIRKFTFSHTPCYIIKN